MNERCILTIAVLPRMGQVWPVEAQLTSPGALPVTVRGSLQLDELELAAETMPRAYGERLGRALFHGAIDSAFIQALGGAGGVLHVALAIEASELQALQWELLCAPFDGRFDHLGTDQRVAFSQRVHSGVTRRFAPLPHGELRALLLVADPINAADYGLSPVDSCAAAAAMRAGLGDMPVDVLGAVPGALGPATLDRLCATLTQRRYAILHVVAHGRHRRDLGESVLFFVDDNGRARPTTQSPLAARLHDLGNSLPPLMFVAACESATEPVGANTDGLARVLAGQLGVAVLIAMRRRISVTTAHRLATAFYQRLLAHGHAEEALVEATAGLGDRADVLVPVLYSRLAGQPLLAPREIQQVDRTGRPGHALSIRRTIALAAGACALAFALAWAVPRLWVATAESASDAPALALRDEPEQPKDVATQPTRTAEPAEAPAAPPPLSPPAPAAIPAKAPAPSAATTRSRPKRSSPSLPVHLREIHSPTKPSPEILNAAKSVVLSLMPKIAPCFRDLDSEQVPVGCWANDHARPWYETEYRVTVEGNGKVTAVRMNNTNTRQQTPDACVAKILLGITLTYPGEYFVAFRDRRALTAAGEHCYVPDK